MDIPVIKRLIGAINSHDLDALVSNFADDVVSEWPAHPARSLRGADQVRRNWAFIFAQFPDIHVEVTASAVAGDEFWGEFHYVRPGAADMRGVKVIKVRGDEIVGARFYMEEVDEAASSAHPMPSVTTE
jgi:hypothetical protein